MGVETAAEAVGQPGAATRQELLNQALEALDDLATENWRHGPGARWARHDLSIAQMHMLMVLHEGGPATVSQMAEAIGISLPSASSALDRLQDHGLVVRQRDLQDRRVVHVILSARGRETAEQACGFKRHKVCQLLHQFERQELEALLTVLAATRRSLSGQLPAKLSGQ
jgi:DNA-binding MarR family transcriptional regulator